MQKSTFIVIACDTDPDRSYFIRDISSTSLSWRGMLEGIPRAKDKLSKLVDDYNQSPIFTWLLRADYQIKHYYGEFDHILKTNLEYLLSLERDGDELGWHPHFWYLDQVRNLWIQNFSDIVWQSEMLDSAFKAFQAILPGRAKSVRMGWTFHNNQTMARLGNLGVKIDLSAIPGIKIDPDSKLPIANYYDWEISPRQPFYPSRIDFRRPALSGEQSLPIIVAPNFIAKSIFWGLFSGVVLAKKMRDLNQIKRALSKRTYMSTITSNPRLFQPILRQLAKDLKKNNDVYYVTPLHPDELIPNIHRVYSLENMEINLQSILNIARNCKSRVKYIRAIDLINYFTANRVTQ